MHPLHRKEDLVVQEVDDEILVYDLRTHKAKCLNPTSSMVWKLCDGTRSPQEISRLLTSKSEKIPVELVVVAIEQLGREELLSGPKDPTFLKGFSRREALKKAGAATAVALPLISVITAPLAAHAQSGAQACVPATHGCTCSTINTGRKGIECIPSIPCATDCRCVHANNGNNHAGDCVV